MAVSRACQRALWQRVIFCSTGDWVCRGVVLTAYVFLTLILGIPYYAQPQLAVGTFVDRDIRAPITTLVQDMEATQRAKEKAREGVVPIYKVVEDAPKSSTRHLQELVAVGDRLRAQAGKLPFMPLEVMSWVNQLYLLELSEAEWQRYSPDQVVLLVNPNYRMRYRDEINYSQLHMAITQARQRYQQAQTSLADAPDMFRANLLKITDDQWQELKVLWQKGVKDLLAGGIVEGLPQDMVRARILSWSGLPSSEPSRDLTLQVLVRVVKPNVRIDHSATARAVLLAEEAVQAVKLPIEAGEVIVKAGTKITEREFAVLDELGLAERQPNWLGIGSVAVANGLAVAIVLSLVKGGLLKLKNADGLAIFLSCTAIALGSVVMIPQLLPLFPLASLGLTLGSFYCRRTATVITMLMAGLISLSSMPSASGYLPIVMGALVAGLLTNRPRARSHLAAVGVVVAVIQALSFVAISLMTGNLPPIMVLAKALEYGAGGLIAAILALGAIPYLEQISYALTPFRLAELADLDRPLLRRLVTEAPGTFQHTLFVANLAEAAARELKADTALVRTGTLYHDIGKTLKPEFFIENQMGQTNPHDEINDPWRSAQIIKEHVSGGLKLAQQYRLPKQLQAFIPEHQGTIIISYFYSQALKQFPDLSADAFRYDGPIPQSRETGIVMLADACEAALRSLGQDVDLQEAKEMILRIFHSRWDDGQLVDSGLTWGELDRIADVFLQVWRERNHGRIKYPAFVKKVDPTGSQLEDTTVPLGKVN